MPESNQTPKRKPSAAARRPKHRAAEGSDTNDVPQETTSPLPRKRKPKEINTELVRCWYCHLSCPPGTAYKQNMGRKQAEWRCLGGKGRVADACFTRANTAGLSPKDILALPVAEEPPPADPDFERLQQEVVDFLYNAEYMSRACAWYYLRTGNLGTEMGEMMRLLAPFTWEGAWGGKTTKVFLPGTFFHALKEIAVAKGWTSKNGAPDLRFNPGTLNLESFLKQMEGDEE